MEGDRDTTHRAKVDSSGKIAIPAAVRTRLGIREGDELLVSEEKDGLRICTFDQEIKAAQALVAAYIPAGVSLVEELFNERRADADRE